MWLLIGFIGLLAGALAFDLAPAAFRGGIIATMLVGAFAPLFGAVMASRVAFLAQSSGGFAGILFAVLVPVIWRAICKPIAR